MDVLVKGIGNYFPWGRKIQVRFYEMKNTGEIGYPLPVVLDGLRTTVDYKGTWGAGNDSCMIEIFNMDEGVEVNLRKYQDRLAVQVYAGYIGSIVDIGDKGVNTSATTMKQADDPTSVVS